MGLALWRPRAILINRPRPRTSVNNTTAWLRPLLVRVFMGMPPFLAFEIDHLVHWPCPDPTLSSYAKKGLSDDVFGKSSFFSLAIAYICTIW